MKERGVNWTARLFKGEAVRRLCAAALVCAPLALLALARAADWYPGNGAAMGTSAAFTLTDPGVLISTPTSPADAGYVSTYTITFNWTGPSTTTAAALGEGSYYLLQVSSAPGFAADDIVISVSTAPEINILAVTHDGSFASTDTLVSGQTYYWRVAAVDGLTLATAPWSQAYSFTLDFTPPTVAVLDPADGSFKNFQPQISGTASDNLVLTQVQVSILHVSNNQYWDGSAWAAAESWNIATLTPPSWTYTSPSWDNDYSFRIVARARDGAGNWSVVYSTSTFGYDGMAPAAVATLDAQPDAIEVSTEKVHLSWTAPGDNGALGTLNGSTYTIQYSTYPEVTWSTEAAQINISTSGVIPGDQQRYTVAGLLANTSYYFRLWTRDEAFNYSGISNSTSTVTMMEGPASVYIDEVGITTLTASAYAPGPAFSNMQHGQSAVAVSTEAGVYDVWSSSGNYWAAKAPMNNGRAWPAAAVAGGKVYVIGGVNGSPTAFNEEYDPVANTWVSRASMPTARYYLAAAAVGGRIYAMGGYDNVTYLKANEEYDPASNAWVKKSSMTVGRQGLAAVALDGKIYAVGGYNGVGLTVNEQYDPYSDTWTTKDPLDNARYGLAAAAAGGKIYAVGGTGGITVTEEYDPAGNSWAAKAPLLTGRSDLAAAAVGGKIFAIGGYSGGSLSATEEYDVSANTWTARAPMTTARAYLAAAATGGRIYAVGGIGFLATNEAYIPGTSRALNGLKPNTQYTFRAKSRNQAGIVGAESGTAVSTYTLAYVGLPAVGQQITAVSSYSAMVVWSTGSAATGWNGSGADFLVEASTSADFLGVKISSYAGDSFSFTAQSLLPNTTYHFRVRAYNAIGGTDYGWLALGSTVTHIEPPTSVYIDEVTTNTIVASAYAPNPAFTGMERGLSAVSIAKGGAYDLWGSSGNYWTVRTPLLTGRSGMGAAALGGKVYVLGGVFGVSYLNKNEEYDPVSNNWTIRTAMPSARAYLAAAALGGKLYAIGGWNGSSTFAQTLEYDPESGTWTQKANMSGGRKNLAAAAVGGKLYAIGGDYVATNEEYDPVLNSWAPKASMLTPRGSLAAGVINGRIYAAGGWNGSVYYDVNEEYDPHLNVWSAKAPMPSSRAKAAAGVVGGKLYVVGGTDGTTLSVTEAYDPAANAWASAASMPTARNYLSAAVVNGRLYAMGGSGNATNNEELSVGTSRKFSALAPNTQYTFKAKARNQAGEETADSVTVSTYTLASVGLPAGEVFSGVTASAASVAWSSGTGTAYNGPGASYLVVASTSADYLGALNVSSYTYNVSSATLSLSANTTYYFRIQAYNSGGMTDYSWLPLGSTVTLVNPPLSMPIVATTTDTITAQWDANSNGAGTLYNIQLYASPSFTPVTDSSQTTDTSYTFRGLAVNTSYYLRVNAVNRSGSPTPWVVLPSTYTAIETPAGITMDAVSSTTINVSAYSPSGFSNLATGQSGIDHAIDGSYNGTWLPTIVASFQPLQPNTFHTFKAKARNLEGQETPESPIVSTYTLAAVAPAAQTFVNVYASSATVAWSSGTAGGGWNASGASYLLQVSTSPDFLGAASSSSTYNLAVTTEGLAANTTYYFRVLPYNTGGMTDGLWLALGSTVTHIETPTSVTMGAVSSTTVAIDAYNAGGFTNLTTADSGIDHAKDGAYAGWVQITGKTFNGLTPNTLYSFKAKARNQERVETDPSAEVSTYTLAYVGLPAVGQPITAVSSYSVTVMWSTGSVLTGWNGAGADFLVEASTSVDFLGVKISSYAGDSFSFVARELLPNTTYHFRVRAYNKGGMTDYSWLALGSTVTHIEAPTTVTVGTVSSTTISVDAYNAGGFTNLTVSQSGINHAKDGAYAGWVQVTAATFTALTPNTLYNFKAKARNQEGVETGPGDTVSTHTLASVGLPAGEVFSGVTASAVSVAWSSGTGTAYNGPGASYLVVASTSADYLGALNVSSYTYNVSSATLGLSANTTYYFRIQAYNLGGMTDYSWQELGSTVTLVNPPVFQPVLAVSSYSVTAQWGSNGNAPDTVYNAQIYSDPGLSTLEISTRVANAYAVLGPLPVANTYYFMQVNAENRAGSPTGWVSLASTATAIQAPEGITFTGYSTITLQTMAQGTFTDLGEELSAIAQAIDGTYGAWDPTIFGYFPGLTPNTSHYIKAKARNRLGVETAETAEFSAYTLAAVAQPQSGEPFTAVWLSSASVAWSSGTAAGGYNGPGARFRLEADTVSDYSGTVIASETYNVDGASLDLAPNTSYYFRVKAFNSVGSSNGIWEALGSTATRIETPSDILFTAVSSDAVAMQVIGGPGFSNLSSGLSSIGKAIDGGAYAWFNSTVETFGSLVPNTQHTFSALARNLEGRLTPGISLSTWTLAEQPGAGAPSFPEVYASSVAVSFSAGSNPAGTEFTVEMSTSAGFENPLSSETTVTSLYFTGLLGNTRYYGRVKAVNGAGIYTAYTDLGSAVTLMTPPTDVYASAVTTVSLVATAYAPTGFPNLTEGLSGINHSTGPVYAGWTQSEARSFTGLTPNTLYGLKAKARGQDGVETAESPVFSTYTLAAVAVSTGDTFTGVNETGVTVWYSSGTDAGGYNGPDALYVLEASTATDFTGSVFLGAMYNPDDLFREVTGLASNTTYHFRVKAYNAGGYTDGNWLLLGSTVTHAIVPAGAAQPFASVATNGMNVYWDQNGNSAETSYRLQISSHQDFSAIQASYFPVVGTSLGPGGLTANTSYYARVAAVSYSGVQTAYYVIGGTITLQNAPDGITFMGVSSRAITAVAYAAGGFPNLSEGDSGISVALDGGYSGWTQLEYAGYTGMIPNTRYTFKAKARNQAATETAESPEVSTYTLAAISAAQAGPVFSGIGTGAATIFWSSGTAADGFNGSTATYRVQVDTAGTFANLLGSQDTAALSGAFSGLWPNTTHYFRGAAFNGDGVFSNDWQPLGSTSTLANVVAGTSIVEVFSTSVTMNWTLLPLAPSSATCEGYLVEASTAASFAAVIKSSFTPSNAQGSLTVQGLFADATYYFRIGTLNHDGVPNYAAAGSTLTLTETEPPVITNNEVYDYTWYGAEARTYNVDFADTGGSMLENFQVKAATAPGQAGQVTLDWTDLAVGIDTETYTADWALGAAWDLLEDGTNYVSVRVYDGAGNLDLVNDAFVVFKDTTPPAISENYADGVWRSTYGFASPLGFLDPHSRIDTTQFSAWTGAGLTGTELIGWTAMDAGAAQTSVSRDLPLGTAEWDLLASGTNYISLRAWDYSVPVNTNTWTDAFVILKDTVPPDAVTDLALVSGSTWAIQAGFSAPQEGPSGIAEFAVHYASYTVAWSTYAVAGGTHVYVSTSGVTAGQQQSFVFPDLSGNTTYYFRAWSGDQAGNWSAVSNAAEIATLAGVPALSGNPQVFTSSAAAAWTPQAAAGFRLEASTDAAHTGVLLTSATSDGAAAALYVTGLSPNTTYYLRLASLNWSGLPNYTGTYEESTFAVAPGSAAPYAEVSSESVRVEWLSGGNGPGTRYALEVSSDSFATVLQSTVVQPAGGGPYYYTFSGLDPNTAYWFNVLAIGNRGDADQWISLGSTVTAPAPPVLLGYSLHVSSADAAWGANGNGPGTIYQAQLSTASNFTGTLLSSAAADVFNFTMGPLTPNTSYYLRLRAVSAVTGMASPYVYSEGLTLAAAPDSVGAWTQGPNNIGVHWNASDNPGISGYGAFAAGTALPAASYGHAAAIAGDLLFVTGGYDGAEYKNAVWSAPLSADGTIGAWTRRRDLPAARYAHSAAALRGRLYVIGGYDGVSPRAEVWSAPISSSGALGEWTAEAALPLAVYAHAFIPAENAMYVLGGYNGGARDNVWYTGVNSDGSLTGWTAGTALPQASYLSAAGISGSHIYVTGGYDSLSAAASVRRAPVNPDGSLGAWVSDAALPSGVYAHAMETLPGALLISGGNGGTLPRSTTLLGALNPDGSVAGWTTGGALPAARQSHVMATRGARLLVLGGYDGSARSDGYYSALAGTEYRLQVTGPSSYATPWQPGGWLDVGSLAPNTYYTFTPVARNYAGVEAPGPVSYSTYTYAAVPSSAAFAGVYISSAQANWLEADNPAGTVYTAELSSDAAHTQPAYSLVSTAAYALFTGLDDDYTYYARVRAANAAGVYTPWTGLGSFTTRADPALDFSSPTITNNQAGDNSWRSAGGTLYDIDFADMGGSYLNRFQVRSATYPASPDGAWTDVLTAMDVSAYSDDWALPAGFFGLLEPGTNYISVRAWDANNNMTDLADAFYVLKDTEAPVITDSQSGENAWRMDDAGAAYDVDFADAVSGLAAIEYSASPNQGSGDAAGYAWTPVAAISTGLKSYADNWAVDFAGLPNDATSFISVRARDLAGNTVTVSGVDVFKILKYVAGPEVGLTAPAAPYHSALAQIEGTADDARSHAILGVEVSVQDTGTGKYWDGADFLASARTWFTAAGTSTWTYAPAITWQEGAAYRVVARSSDTAGNYSLTYATASFIYDSQAPELGLTAPADGATVNSAAAITGTALDVSGVAGLALRFKRLSDAYWWDFNASTWTVAGSSAAVAPAASWTYSPPQLLRAWLASGASYYYSVYAVDSSSPASETPFYVYAASFTFTDDTPPAAVADLSASTGSVPGSMRLNWTAPGDDAADGMILAGRYLVQYSTWPGAAFSTASAQVSIDFSQGSAGSARFTELTGLVAGQTYYARVWTRDDAGNWSALSNGATSQAAPFPDQIGGHVTKVSSEGVTGVLVEVYDASGLLQGSAYTLNDGSGTYMVNGLSAGSYRVQATWSANDIISSVGTDSVALGTVNADFTLAVSYELASIGGSLPGYAPARPGLSPSAARPRCAPPVELYQRGRLVATAQLDAAGRFLISNLLPGSYTLRVPNPEGGAKELSVRLKPGEALQVSPLGAVLKTDKVYVYPNPASSLAAFHLESDQALGALRISLAIFDITGKLVGKLSEKDFSGRNGGLEADWSVPSKVAPGVYVYSLHVKFEATGEHKKVVRKFAIVK